MRKIKTTEGLSITLNHAGLNSEGLTNCLVSIPLDPIKYLQGVNLIDCIKPNALPDVLTNLNSVNQTLTAQELELIRGWLITGIANDDSDQFAGHPEYYYFLTEDDAMKGTIQINDGDTKITYLP